MILGIDEVGRGPWAGPLVVGAVVLPTDHTIEGLTDSKKLTKRQRERLSPEIIEQAHDWALGWVRADELDEIGMTEALKLATRRAVAQIKCPYHEIIIDGTSNFLAGTRKERFVSTLKKADLLIAAVSAASIIAKVARDAYMTKQANIYPEYGFERHAGYGTAIHRQAIERYGVTPLHRLSFAPLQKYRASESMPSSSQSVARFARDSPDPADAVKPVTKEIGDRAERVVAAYLEHCGHTILARNWRTKFCEIDIISQNEDTIYFTEVKYRRTNEQGGGFAAITPKKMRQMKFAAEYYLVRSASSTNAQLAVAEVTGEPFVLSEWVTVV